MVDGMSGKSVPSVTPRWPKPLLLTVAQAVAGGSRVLRAPPGQLPVDGRSRDDYEVAANVVAAPDGRAGWDSSAVWTIDGAALKADDPVVSGRRSQQTGRSARGGSTMPRLAMNRLRRRRSPKPRNATSPAAPPTSTWALRWPDRQRCRTSTCCPWSFGDDQASLLPGRPTPKARQGAWPDHAGPVGQQGGGHIKKLVVLALGAAAIRLAAAALADPAPARPFSPS
jgi:hypothetical protein